LIKIRHNIKKIGVGFAYFCIYTTPIQLGIIGWQIFIITSSEYSILTMSTKDFLVENIRFLHDWIYSLFWNHLLDFVYQFPALIVSSIKAIVNYFLGYWLLRKLSFNGRED